MQDKNKIYFFIINDVNKFQNYYSSFKNDLSKFNNNIFSVEEYDLTSEDSINDLLSTGVGIPLFVNNQLVQIKFSLKLIQKIDQNNELLLDLIKYLTSISVNKIIIILLITEKYDADIKNRINNSVFLNKIKSISDTKEFVKLNYWQLDEIKAEIISVSKSYDLSFEPEALHSFLEHIKNNYGNLDSEIAKISLYILPSKKVTVRDINELCSIDFTVEDLFESIIENSKDTLMNKITSVPILTKPPLYLLAALQNKFRIVFHMKLLNDLRLDKYQISKAVGVHYYKVEKELADVKNVNSKQLQAIISFLSNLEYKIKSGFINESLMFDYLLFTSV